MKFVDRKDETKRLKEALTSDKPSLVVMYGRRRLGKLTLIKRVLSDSDVFFLLIGQRVSISDHCWQK